MAIYALDILTTGAQDSLVAVYKHTNTCNTLLLDYTYSPPVPDFFPTTHVDVP